MIILTFAIGFQAYFGFALSLVALGRVAFPKAHEIRGQLSMSSSPVAFIMDDNEQCFGILLNFGKKVFPFQVHIMIVCVDPDDGAVDISVI